ncbi:MAG: hypothetical protein D6767_10520 [Candidatus Hydrogenedentota bacterium]|nr:MAG: hypothetical protein D6767_10520 [Candidatus Hydrogenedentota bacterium]
MQRRIASFLIFDLFVSVMSLYATKAGGVSLPFLRIPATPPAQAMLGGGTALGSSSWYGETNPAVVALQDYSELLFSYRTLPFNFSTQSFLWTKPTLAGTLGLGLRYFGSPPIEVYDDNFNKEIIHVNDIALSTMYAIHFADFSFGLSGKYIESRLGGFTARAVSLDAGSILYFDAPALLEPTRNLNLGISLGMRNLSPGIQYAEITTPLPFTYYAAIFYNIITFDWMEANLEVAWERLHELSWNLGPGMEIKFGEYGALRGSVVQTTLDGSRAKSWNFSGGLSLYIPIQGYVYDLAYTITPGGELGFYHQFGLRIQFGGGKNWPWGLDKLFGKPKGKSDVKTLDFTEAEDSNLDPEDRIILIQLRRSIYNFRKQKGRYPRDLNELLLYLNEYRIYEIPNPKRGKYRYNKRTGKLFIRD